MRVFVSVDVSALHWRFSARPVGRRAEGVISERADEGQLSSGHGLSCPSSRSRFPGWQGCTCVAGRTPRSPANSCTGTIPPCWCTARCDIKAPCRRCPRTRLCLGEKTRGVRRWRPADPEPPFLLCLVCPHSNLLLFLQFRPFSSSIHLQNKRRVYCKSRPAGSVTQ